MKDEWPQYYILMGRVPIAVDMLTWGRWCNDVDKRRIARTVIDDTPTKIRTPFGRTETRPRCFVSTVFLGLDHGWDNGEPILFETMVFGGPLTDYQERYCTYAQAEAGHAVAVKLATEALAKIDGIREDAHKG